MTTSFRRSIVAALALACSPPANADSWPGPQIREVFSADRSHFIRVTPGSSWGDTMGFKGEPKGPYATAEFYERQGDGAYRAVHKVSLANPVAPVSFYVSNSGRLLTIDNWHNAGYGKVVAIYDPQGGLVKAWALDELFMEKEIEGFMHSVSSIHWSHGAAAAYIREDQRTFYLHTVDDRYGGGFLFGLETGRYSFCETRDGVFRCRNSVSGGWKTGAESLVER